MLNPADIVNDDSNIMDSDRKTHKTTNSSFGMPKTNALRSSLRGSKANSIQKQREQRVVIITRSSQQQSEEMKGEVEATEDPNKSASNALEASNHEVSKARR